MNDFAKGPLAWLFNKFCNFQMAGIFGEKLGPKNVEVKYSANLSSKFEFGRLILLHIVYRQTEQEELDSGH